MRALWTSDEIAAATGGAASTAFEVDGVTFDSREVLAGSLFVALRGEKMDGHAFVAQAAERGASGFLVEKPVDGPHVQVAAGLPALEALGKAARARISLESKIIGVTGSVGKTGTKEALRLAFERMAPDATHASVKSYNNHTGVPLSLSRMPADTRYGVFEMGMNHSGEIAALTRMVRPHVAVITWVGGAHIEHFADGEAGIARAKAEIFQGVESGGTAVYPADNVHAPLLRQAAEQAGLQILSFGWDAAADVRVVRADVGAFGTDLVADVAGEEVHLKVGMAGRHWVGNALAVLAAVKAVGGDLGQAALALAELQDLPGRGARVRIAVADGEALLIDESYNANPVSMRAALAVLRDTPAKRRLAVLGAMRELGAETPQIHADLAAPMADAGVELAALVGAEMQALQISGAEHLANTGEAIAWARTHLRDGDALLIKGSNSVGLGALVAALKDKA